MQGGRYQEHIEALDDEEAIRVLEHIRDDEKEHVAELFKLIQALDPLQAEKFQQRDALTSMAYR